MNTIHNTLSNKARVVLVSSVLLCVAFIASNALADVPVRNDIVDCSCVKSNSQTCASANLGSLGFMVDSVATACDSGNNYSVIQYVEGTNNNPGIVGTLNSTGNSSKATGNIIQTCGLSYGLPMVDGVLTTTFNCISPVIGFSALNTSILSTYNQMGYPTGVACKTANGVGILHLTGYTLFTSISIGGFNSSGSNGNVTGSPGSSIVYKYVDNYSCY